MANIKTTTHRKEHDDSLCVSPAGFLKVFHSVAARVLSAVLRSAWQLAMHFALLLANTYGRHRD
jgi:hypothetical protein